MWSGRRRAPGNQGWQGAGAQGARGKRALGEGVNVDILGFQPLSLIKTFEFKFGSISQDTSPPECRVPDFGDSGLSCRVFGVGPRLF